MPKSSLPIIMVSEENIIEKICNSCAKVMLDKDLAAMYGVEVKRLNEAVKRNATRFPEDFMFQLPTVEYDSLRSQIATLEKGRHTKYLPYAFTEQGVAMLSSVLNSENSDSGKHPNNSFVYENETTDFG